MTQTISRPRAVRIAAWLAIGIAAVGAIQAVNAFAEKRNLADAITEAGKYMSIDQVIYRTGDLRGSLSLALGLGLITLALPLLAILLTQGRRWARVLTWIVAGLLVIGELILTSADSSAVKTGDFVSHFDVPGGDPQTVEMLNRLLVPLWFPPIHYLTELAILIGGVALCIQLARPAVADYFRREVEVTQGPVDDRVWSTDAVRSNSSDD